MRLSAWINGDEETAQIPVSSKGVWVHCPVEVRVTHSGRDAIGRSGVRPYLDPTVPDGPTLYLNATLYRPYGRDPPCHQRYYQAFEYLMRELGGRPHWAKNFAHAGSEEIEAMYGEDMVQFMKVRDESDPEGMFLGEWHKRTLPLNLDGEKGTGGLRLMEEEVRRTKNGLGSRFGDGVLWEGRSGRGAKDEDDLVIEGENVRDGGETPSPPATTTSEESFDYMAKGEASVYAVRGDGE